MKMRKGFVSNSSSASYIVNIKGIDFDGFCDVLNSNYNSFNDYFSLSVLRNKLGQIEANSTRYTEDGNDRFNKEIKAYRKRINNIDEDDYPSIVKYAFDFYKMGCEVKKDGVELLDFTSMHNDYDSGMGSLMKEIVLHFLFETDFKVVCKIEDD